MRPSLISRRDFGLETEMEEEAENGDVTTGTDNEGIEGGTTDNPKDSSDDGQVSHDPVQNEDGDTKKSPRFYLRLSKNLDKFLGSFTNLRKEENAKRKLDEIVEEEETLVYMRLKCSTMSFVWERREAILQQLQQPEAGAHENETGAKSSSKKLSNRKIRRITQPRNLAFEETYKLDPLELQTRVTQIIVNNHPIQVDKGKSVPLLGFNVMVKFDKRWMNENPAFFLIFEKVGLSNLLCILVNYSYFVLRNCAICIILIFRILLYPVNRTMKPSTQLHQF